MRCAHFILSIHLVAAGSYRYIRPCLPVVAPLDGVDESDVDADVIEVLLLVFSISTACAIHEAKTSASSLLAKFKPYTWKRKKTVGKENRTDVA